MLTCREMTELVTDYAEGHLSFVDRVRFHVHLGICRHCRRYVRQMKASVAALGMVPAPELSPQLEQELLRRFERWSGKRG
jgi:anti-sigma factor ChrR (cupin superfamily)